MPRLFLTLVALLFVAAPAAAQNADETPEMLSPVRATSPEARRAALETRRALFENSLLAHVPVHNIGPTVMSGRVVDVDAWETDPSHFYVAYASGGLWKTTNNGQSFEPLFDHENVMTLGDIAVDWGRETVWVGTGENNSSRSSYAGDGVYRSDDGGKTWRHMGLTGTQRTGRIVLHPDDPNTVWVAAAGPLYSDSEHRGVFMTTDRGETWQKTLYVDEKTGAIDLVIDPRDPNVLYASMWERERRAWNFVESGRGSGIYKSTDGGRTWTLLTDEDSGFPTGEGVGRIGLDVWAGDPDILYAILDNQYHRPDDQEDDEEEGLTRDDLRDMTRAEFLALENEQIENYLRDENFPRRYDAETVRDMVDEGTIEPVALVEFVEDANALLFDTPVIGLEIYKSTDGGETWARTHEDYLDGVYNTYGYYFGEVRVAPQDPDRVYAMGVPILRSDDGGATWTSIGDSHVHADHHALWLNPSRDGHLINGNDGGLNVSYDRGDTWSKLNIPPVGQFYAIQVDDAERYRVYGGLQDNGTWVGPHTYSFSYDWFDDGDYPYDRLGGGDGMQVEVDTRTNESVYYGSQFGFYSRVDRDTGDRQFIRPQHELGERPLRFNWQTPIHLSSHNQDILYYGANRLYRSMNRGEDLQPISPDLTKGGLKGDVPYGTLTTIDESPLRFGLIYVGSDDGLIHVTRDGGFEWTRIDENLPAGVPKDLWVSRVEASNHEEGRVYATLNGYRWDHFDAYVFVSDDYGATWRRIGTDLPVEPVNVVLEDPENGDVLFVGTDHAVYASLDGGETFMGFAGDMPKAPVHDLKIQPRAKDLLIGTHGRSIFRADLEQIQLLTEDVLTAAVHAFDVNAVMFSDGWGDRRASWSSAFEPSVDVPVFASDAGEATVRILTEDGAELQSFETDLVRGLQVVEYDLTISEAGAEVLREGLEEDETLEAADNGSLYLRPGTYTVRVEHAGRTAETDLEVRERGGGGGGVPEPDSIPEPPEIK